MDEERDEELSEVELSKHNMHMDGRDEDLDDTAEEEETEEEEEEGEEEEEEI